MTFDGLDDFRFCLLKARESLVARRYRDAMAFLRWSLSALNGARCDATVKRRARSLVFRAMNAIRPVAA